MDGCSSESGQSVVFYSRLEVIYVTITPGKGDVGHIDTHKVIQVLHYPGHSKGDDMVKVHELGKVFSCF